MTLILKMLKLFSKKEERVIRMNRIQKWLVCYTGNPHCKNLRVYLSLYLNKLHRLKKMKTQSYRPHTFHERSGKFEPQWPSHS